MINPFKLVAPVLGVGFLISIGALAVTSSQVRDARAKLATEKQVVANLAGRVAQSESSRKAEREQCAADFAGLNARAKDEAERAAKSASAIATLTKNCVFDRGQPAVNRALRDVLGETKR
jgi:hypothetical protein